MKNCIIKFSKKNNGVIISNILIKYELRFITLEKIVDIVIKNI